MFEVVVPAAGRVKRRALWDLLWFGCGLVLLGFGLLAWSTDVKAPTAALAGVVMAGSVFRRVPQAVQNLRARVLTLRLDDAGPEVFYGRVGDRISARLAWSDCAVVAACSRPGRRGPIDYVQFLPKDDARVDGDREVASARGRARLLGVTPAVGLMTWFASDGPGRGAEDVLAEVRRSHPELPVRDLRADTSSASA